jgi:hypothetical protein
MSTAHTRVQHYEMISTNGFHEVVKNSGIDFYKSDIYGKLIALKQDGRFTDKVFPVVALVRVGFEDLTNSQKENTNAQNALFEGVRKEIKRHEEMGKKLIVGEPEYVFSHSIETLEFGTLYFAWCIVQD